MRCSFFAFVPAALGYASRSLVLVHVRSERARLDDGSLERRVHVRAREGRGEGREREPEHPGRERRAGEGGGARQRGVPTVRGDGAGEGGEDERGDARSVRGGGGCPAGVDVDAAGGFRGERGGDPAEDEREGGERVEAREARGGYRGLGAGVELDVDNLVGARGRARGRGR